MFETTKQGITLFANDAIKIINYYKGLLAVVFEQMSSTANIIFPQLAFSAPDDCINAAPINFTVLPVAVPPAGVASILIFALLAHE